MWGYSGRITNSWGWIKMVRSLWKQNFTVCLLDMPGFGRSSVNMRWNTPQSEWLHMDAVILAKFINGMNFRKSVSFIAYRESCASVLKLCLDSPHLVGQRQLLVDPVFTLDDIFPIEAPYGAQMDWFRDKPGKQAIAMDRMMGRNRMNFWICFTGTPGSEAALDAFQMVVAARPHLGMRISITHLTKEFISEARAGSKVSTELLFLCKYIKDRFALYVAGVEKAPQEIPSWALDVVSTNASTAIGSKAVPSIDSPAGRARNFDALETVQEAAEVLSRHTTAENFFPAQNRRKSNLQDIPEVPSQHIVMPKRNLPKLAAFVNNEAVSDSTFTDTLRQTTRMDGSHSGFRDRSKGSKNAVKGNLGMSRYGANLMGTRSEAILRDDGFKGLPSLGYSRSTQAMQRTAHGVVVCRPELPPPPFKTEASRCSINSCAKKASQKRIEDPEIGRHRLICPTRKTQKALDATGYRATTPRKRTVQEVLAELKGSIPNL